MRWFWHNHHNNYIIIVVAETLMKTCNENVTQKFTFNRNSISQISIWPEFHAKIMDCANLIQSWYNLDKNLIIARLYQVSIKKVSRLYQVWRDAFQWSQTSKYQDCIKFLSSFYQDGKCLILTGFGDIFISLFFSLRHTADNRSTSAHRQMVTAPVARHCSLDFDWR